MIYEMNYKVQALKDELDPKRLVQALPDGPGVYLFKEPQKKGAILFQAVGRASPQDRANVKEGIRP